MADEAVGADLAPRDGDERTERAVEAMVVMGLERDLVIRTLKRLYKAFDGSEEWWAHVELEGYRILADEVCNLQTKLEAKRARAADGDDTPEGPKRTEDYSRSSPSRHSRSPPSRHPHSPPPRHSQSPPRRVGRVSGYEQRSATALKVLATDLIKKEEKAGRKQMQMDAKMTPSLLHSRGGFTPRTDGRGVKLIDPSEAIAAKRRPDDSTAHKKLKQLKEEFEPQSAPTTSRKQFSNSIGSKKLKRLRQAEECRRELKELVENDGEAHGSDHDINHNSKQRRHDVKDLSRGFEAIPIPIVNQSNSKTLPSSFFYLDKSRPYEKAFVNTAISRIGDDECCPNCHDNCLSAPHLCACVRDTGGDFAYTSDGCLQRRYIDQYMKVKYDGIVAEKMHYCASGFHCPHERHKNEENPAECKGHPVRDFVKECSSKCGCSKQCGNRVVQRGINRRLEVFMTPQGKGWGIRTLEDLPAGAFAFEYVGEILTNTEMWERNKQVHANGKGYHTYPITLDSDWGSEANLKDEEALCLDATFFGNVARFLNHRCLDANLMNMPVEIETPDRHYYHVAFFTNRPVKAKEELTWDYGIDFDDDEHPVPAFSCKCHSDYCRGNKMQLGEFSR